MAKAKTKTIRKSEAGNVVKLRDGRFRIDCLDSRGKRHRPAFATKDEAFSALDRITARKSKGEFYVESANTTLATVFGYLKERNKTEVGKGAQDLTNSKINVLGAEFGAREMTWFADDRLQTVQKWFNDQAANGRAKGTLQGDRSVLSMAFKEAVKRKILPYNPLSEFELRVPRNAKEPDSKPLSLQDMTVLVRAVLTRTKQDKNELTFRARRMMTMLGMFTGMRNEECSGLFWDCVDGTERAIHVRRIWREGEGIVETTKTGEGGKRSIPMSPVLLAELLSYGDRLKQLGMPLQGPVLITAGASIIKPEAISSQHWPVIARKAGFVDAHDDHLYTFYDLRHTDATILRTIGMESDDLQSLMGHSDYKTTVERYIHRAPHLYPGIRRDVESLGFGRTPEDLVDALGLVLARRWKDEGIDIGCAPPRTTAVPQIGHNGGMIALPSPILDLTAESVETPQASDPASWSVEDLRKRQRARAAELHAQGWTVQRICAELKADRTTVKAWLRHSHIPDRRGRLPADVREDLKRRLPELRKQHPDWITIQFAEALGVHSGRITEWERERGKPMPHRNYAHKIGKHEARIRQMVAEGKTYREMAKILGDVSPTGIRLFVKDKLGGLKTKRWAGGERIDQYDADIIRMVAEGKNGKEIAAELHTVSHSGVCNRIKQLSLKTESERRANAAKARAKKALRRQQLSLDLGT